MSSRSRKQVFSKLAVALMATSLTASVGAVSINFGDTSPGPYIEMANILADGTVKNSVTVTENVKKKSITTKANADGINLYLYYQQIRPKNPYNNPNGSLRPTPRFQLNAIRGGLMQPANAYGERPYDTTGMWDATLPAIAPNPQVPRSPGCIFLHVDALLKKKRVASAEMNVTVLNNAGIPGT
jgi:hypothetical protein